MLNKWRCFLEALGCLDSPGGHLFLFMILLVVSSVMIVAGKPKGDVVFNDVMTLLLYSLRGKGKEGSV